MQRQQKHHILDVFETRETKKWMPASLLESALSDRSAICVASTSSSPDAAKIRQRTKALKSAHERKRKGEEAWTMEEDKLIEMIDRAARDLSARSREREVYRRKMVGILLAERSYEEVLVRRKEREMEKGEKEGRSEKMRSLMQSEDGVKSKRMKASRGESTTKDNDENKEKCIEEKRRRVDELLLSLGQENKSEEQTKEQSGGEDKELLRDKRKRLDELLQMITTDSIKDKNDALIRSG
ncbi:uncharacterized protein V2V93DRAFT_371903 [Kockiozyma suomiensis]|uniref:uncharacterized protein n=1 Tax=Kockiozyma suomiensis TaxID=1337062 RepID=UPI0033434647